MANLFDDFDLDIEKLSGGGTINNSRSEERSGCGCPTDCGCPTNPSGVDLESKLSVCRTEITCGLKCTHTLQATCETLCKN